MADRLRGCMCRGCGCTDRRACVTAAGPCAWVLMDIELIDVPGPTGVCSSCAVMFEWDQELLANFFHPQVRNALVRAHGVIVS